ncbi:hypothetical protein Tco_0573679 [Tanacetum coccineum]
MSSTPTNSYLAAFVFMIDVVYFFLDLMISDIQGRCCRSILKVQLDDLDDLSKEKCAFVSLSSLDDSLDTGEVNRSGKYVSIERMDTLSLVSKYLNDMEDILDDGDSIEARKLAVGKSKEELELFEALDHKSVIVKEGSHMVVVFKKAPPRACNMPFIRFSLPCDVDGQGTWDAELDMADLFNYITEERFDQLGFVRVNYGKYGRQMVKEVHVEIHGFTFLVDFVVIGYANEGEPSVIFGRDFLVTSKSRVDFGIGEMRIDLTMLEDIKDIDVMLYAL